MSMNTNNRPCTECRHASIALIGFMPPSDVYCSHPVRGFALWGYKITNGRQDDKACGPCGLLFERMKR